jgi:hypothetical protein
LRIELFSTFPALIGPWERDLQSANLAQSAVFLIAVRFPANLTGLGLIRPQNRNRAM